MTEADIRAKVRGAVANVCGIDVADVPDSAHFVNDLGLDSLSVVEALVELEREFRLGDATEEDEARLVGIDEAVQYIQKKINLQTV